MTRADPIRAALERLIELNEECTEEQWTDAIAAAHAALADQQGEGPSDKELNTLWNCSGIADEHGNHTGNIFEFARAVLARWGHQPTPPAEGEVRELVLWLRENAEDERQMCESSNRASLNLERAAELLQQQHPTPVPVSEGWPEFSDCEHVNDQTWCFNPLLSHWKLTRIKQGVHTHWLPAHALPLPQGEVE